MGETPSRSASTSVQISVRLPEDWVQELDSIAETQGTSRAKVIRDALRLYLRDMRIFGALADVDQIDLKNLEKMFAKDDKKR